MRYAAVLVDAGRVLIHPDDAFFRREARALGHPLAAAAAMTALGRTVWEGAASADPIAFWNGTAKIDAWTRHAGLSPAMGRTVWDRVHERDRHVTPLWSRPDPIAGQALRKLAAVGYPIAVVSNNDGRLRQQLTATGLIHHFTAVVDSTIVGVAKPSAEIFNRAAEQLGVQLGDCLMIGDDPYFDILASQLAGIAGTILIDPGSDRPCTWPTAAYPELLSAVSALLAGAA